MKPCCEKFVEEDEGDRPHMAHDERRRVWNVEGCCGGCYVIKDLVFCPWCGSRLPGTECTG